MVVHPTMEFKFCFSYVLLLTFTAVNEVTYVIGFTCDRLLDVVCFRVLVTGYGCGEVSFFAGQFEKKMLASFPHKPLVYFRYIDDIFMIWTEGEDTLNQFFNHCNSLNPSIQFEQTISNTNIPFLDVNIIFENS